MKFIVLTLALIGVVAANSNGGSEICCEDMVPKHPVSPQSSPFGRTGYKVSLSKNAISDNDEVHITLAGDRPYKGYLLQVRDGDTAVGSFHVPGNDAHSKTINCFTKQKDHHLLFHSTLHKHVDTMVRRWLGMLCHLLNQLPLPIDFNDVFFRGEPKHNMATHNNADDKKSVTVVWKPPRGAKKTYTVFATVAQDGGVFWVKQPTEKITIH